MPGNPRRMNQRKEQNSRSAHRPKSQEKKGNRIDQEERFTIYHLQGRRPQLEVAIGTTGLTCASCSQPADSERRRIHRRLREGERSPGTPADPLPTPRRGMHHRWLEMMVGSQRKAEGKKSGKIQRTDLGTAILHVKQRKGHGRLKAKT